MIIFPNEHLQYVTFIPVHAFVSLFLPFYIFFSSFCCSYIVALYIVYLHTFGCLSACQHGHFGEECAERCMETCAGCNNVNGLCDSGCLSGWFGYFCNKGIDISEQFQ